jgi:hypothetical protein
MYEADPAEFPELRGPRADGVQLVRALTDPYIGIFDDDVNLLSESPSSKILHEAEKFFAAAGVDDVALLYYSGHGYRANGQLFLCARNTQSKYMESTAIPDSALNRVLSRSRARAKVVILDCCYSGAFKGAPDVERLAGHGRYILAATSPTHEAKDAEDGQQLSPFTRWLIDALRTGATDRDGDGTIDLDDVYTYIAGVALDGPRPFRTWSGSGSISIARRESGSNHRHERPSRAKSFVAYEQEKVPFLDRVTGMTPYSPERVSAFRKDMKQDVELGLSERMSALDFLHTALLMRDGLLTQAGALLFGERPTAVFPTAVIQCSRIRGTDKNALTESRTLRGTLPEQIIKAQQFVTELAVRGEEPAEGEARSRTVFAYPMITVREVVANAVVHRDYEHTESCVHVRVFADRIEVSSPGAWIGRSLAAGEFRTLGELIGESRRRNFRLADVLGWMKLVEGEGAGLPRAVHECRAEGFREPTVSQVDNMVTITIYPRDDDVTRKATSRSVPNEVINWDFSRRFDLIHQASTRLAENLYVGTQDLAVRSGRIPSGVLERTRATFIPPAEWADLTRILHSRHSLVIRARAGLGSTTTALRLLLDTGADEILVIDSSAGLDRIADWLERRPRNTAYLLDRPGPVEILHESVLFRIESALTETGSRLVIVVDDGAPSGIDTASFVVRLTPSVAPHDVFRSHLSWHLKDHDSEARSAAEEWATSYVDSAASVNDAVALAEIIGQTSDREGGFYPDEVARRWESRTENQIQLWFDSLPTTDLRTLAIALAVLDGLPYDRVIAAATMLNQRLHRTPQPSDVPPFSSRRLDRLHAVRAHLERSVVQGAYGPASTALAKFDNPRVARQTLLHLWEEYDVERAAILEWLSDLVVDDWEPVRVFAAAAVGVLATQSFDYISESVLSPWASSDNRRHREAVINALRLVIFDVDTHGRIPQIIADWQAEGSSLEARATAALAYGSGLAGMDLGGALAALGRLAENATGVVAESVGHAVADLATGGDPAVLEVVDALARWSRDRDRASTGRLAFTVLATSIATVRAEDGQGVDITWPLLLRAMRDLDNVRPPVVGLWGEVLNDPTNSAQALQILREWVRMAERHPDVRESLVRFLHSLTATSERVRAILQHAATTWSRDHSIEMSPAFADEITAVINAT